MFHILHRSTMVLLAQGHPTHSLLFLPISNHNQQVSAKDELAIKHAQIRKKQNHDSLESIACGKIVCKHLK
jgi:hypothetical protein